MLRKPYVIGNYMYSNGVRVSQVKQYNETGYLKNTIWGGETNSVVIKGQAMFRGQCMACHTIEGYRSMKKLLAGRDEQGIMNILNILHNYKEDSPYRLYMPPLVGTDDEIKALATFLQTLVEKPAPPSENPTNTVIPKG